MTLRMVVRNHNKPHYRKEIQAMKNTTTVLADLLSLFPRSDFEKAVSEFKGDHRTRTLGCYDLTKILLFGQATGAYSVREIESTLKANSSRLYHSGLKEVKKSTLCDAMEKRDHRIFERAFLALVETAKCIAGKNKRTFKNPLKIIDATTIDLCLTRFEWAKFRKAKGAVKLHVAIDGDHLFPEQVHITDGSIHEVKMLSSMHFNAGDIAVLDRGYIDFNRLREIDLRESYFVTRLKKNADYQIIETMSYSLCEPVRGDRRIELSGVKAKKAYPDALRMVEFHDDEHNRDYQFLTNNFELSAKEIADIYKARWQVELFFKWIKQNLKIKTFWGTSANAVRIQIWIALILFLLLWIKKSLICVKESLQRMRQVLKTTFFIRACIEDLFKPSPPKPVPSGNWLFEECSHV